MGGVTGKAWQRALKGGDVETFVRVEGASIHVFASPAATDDVLSMFEEVTGKQVPPFVRMKPRYGRSRPRRPLDGQLTIDDAFAGAA